ncbi:MAG: hypothetical protein ACOX87_09805 [Chloroflexota bacterium]
MSDRFECSLDTYLADIFAEKLSNVLEAAGYEEVLRIPEPNVTEFRRNNEVISLQLGHSRAQKQMIVVESEIVDVAPLVAAAARDTIVEISDQLLGSLPWLDSTSVRMEIKKHLSNLIASAT